MAFVMRNAMVGPRHECDERGTVPRPDDRGDPVATIRIDAPLPAAPADVWHLIRDAGNLSWWPGVQSSELRDMTRWVTLTTGAVLEEPVITIDDELRRLQYTIVGPPLNAEFCTFTVDVLDFDGRTLLVYSCDVKPDALAAMLKPALDAAVASLRNRFGG
jgi:hypothetical protein